MDDPYWLKNVFIIFSGIFFYATVRYGSEIIGNNTKPSDLDQNVLRTYVHNILMNFFICTYVRTVLRVCVQCPIFGRKKIPPFLLWQQSRMMIIVVAMELLFILFAPLLL